MKLKKILESICLTAVLATASCHAGDFKVVRFNDAPSYEKSESTSTNESNKPELRKARVAFFNAADFRGNTGNLFQIISKETSKERVECFGTFCRYMGADIMALSEIDYAETLKTGEIDQPQELAKSMGDPYNYVVVDKYMDTPLWSTGNAMVSRFPVKTVQRHLYGEDNPLDDRIGYLFKDFLHVKIKIGDHDVDFILNHFDDGEGPYSFRKIEEARAVNDYILELVKKNPHRYIISVGDYNAGKDSRTMKILLSSGLLKSADNLGIPTYPADKPKIDIDHILFSKNISSSNFRTFAIRDENGKLISDHRGVMVDLELKAYTAP